MDAFCDGAPEQRGKPFSLFALRPKGATTQSIAPKIGCVPLTLYEWIGRHEVDTGTRDGVTTAKSDRIKDLEREVKELRRANENLKLAGAFFAQAKLDRRLK